MSDWSKHYASRMSRMAASEIREILKLLGRPNIVSFGGGIPDPALFPREEIAAAYQKFLGDPKLAGQALQYATTEGYQPLREWVAQEMGKRGLECTADNVLIVSGSQQALDFIGKIFISPGDTVLANWPTFLGALQSFNAYEPVYDILPGAANDREPASPLPPSSRTPKFGYVIPQFSNPTGVSLNEAQRNELLDYAEKMDLPLVEDNAYERLRYSGEEPPLLITLAAKRAGGIENAKVLYLGTFSKSLVPSLRVGWVVGPKEVITKLVFAKQGSDLHTSPLSQMVLHEVAEKIIVSHTAKMRDVYKRRRDALLTALDNYMPQGVTWTKPEGGLFVWVTLPEKLNAAEVLKRALDEINVAFVPGSAFYPDRSGTNTLRLSFSLHEAEVINPAIEKLGGLIVKMIKEI